MLEGCAEACLWEVVSCPGIFSETSISHLFTHCTHHAGCGTLVTDQVAKHVTGELAPLMGQGVVSATKGQTGSIAGCQAESTTVHQTLAAPSKQGGKVRSLA